MNNVEIAKKLVALAADLAKAGNEHRIKITYEVITPESAEQGDVSDRGWEDEDGQVIEPEDEEETYGQAAAHWFRNNCGALEASSYPGFHPGIWYTDSDATENYRTGESRYQSYHLDGFTPEEQKECFEILRQQKQIH